MIDVRKAKLLSRALDDCASVAIAEEKGFGSNLAC